MEICFYHINNDYINFLKKYEREKVRYTCVPNIQYKTSDKFVFGAVMDINGINYFVPVSSYGKKQEDVILIRDKKKKTDILGSLRFAYMLPVPRPCLIKLDINSIVNEYSKTHISKELAFCRRERDKIFKQAEKTYFRVISKVNEQLVKNSCDFKVLEQAYIEYCIINKLECPHIDEGSLKFIEETLKIKKYAEAVQEKYNERNTGHDEHDKNNPKR
ncbi:MAG: type III toxin-antitoxin system ToxN/AbiQ family toxin [Lachnospiraceae bacterium]|nr:type III toxin-antitoxin system ToxN/AbiQ family toxin [Lachnospiraceae bacterium]